MSASAFLGLSIKPHNDLELDAAGNLKMVSGSEAIAQHVRQRLMFWLGEWFLDRSAGVDWLRYVLGKAENQKPVADAVIKRCITQTPGVVEILEYHSEIDRASRGLRVVKCRIRTTLNDVVTVSL